MLFIFFGNFLFPNEVEVGWAFHAHLASSIGQIQFSTSILRGRAGGAERRLAMFLRFNWVRY